MAKDLLENLFDSIDLIVTNKLGDLNYDKTEQCTIQEVKGNNEYYVSNGAAKYIAYAQNDAQYKEGDSVYVTIPQGNYNNQKLIIGKHTAKKSAATDWVSPMENFVNITGSINPSHAKAELIANNPNINYVKIWGDSKKVWTGYDRLCITGDFSTNFAELVIDGSYGLMLTGTIEDSRLEDELAKLSSDMNKEIADLGPSATDKQKEEIFAKYRKKEQEIKDKYKSGSVPLEGNTNNFACLLDTKDMLGNPYLFDVPFRQEKLFAVEPTSKISNLALYFYQGLSSDQAWKPNIITANNYITTEDENGYQKENFTYNENTLREIGFDNTSVADIFVENATINFGYSYENYSDDTAVLYTLDSKSFGAEEGADTTSRELRLRWVHYDDNQKPHSITDLNNSILKYHYSKIRWYKYDPTDEKTKTTPDELAGYFWVEMPEHEDKFNAIVNLKTQWQEEKFKVIIQYDDRVIKSEELVFNNPGGTSRYGELLTGLEITFPQDDKYKGTFYIYGDDHNPSFSTEKPFKLIAKYKSVDESGKDKIWSNSDVICWLFPADYTMIRQPEAGFEYFTELKSATTGARQYTDVFLAAGTEGAETAEVNGITFKTMKDYHQIIRRVETDKDGKVLTNTQEQNYRIKGMFSSSTNNTIKCKVYKPGIVSAVEDDVTFLFGLHTTNGTKYTLVVDWEETANSGTYQRPPAITYGDTQTWKFNVEILDAKQERVTAPDGGWAFDISWYENRANDHAAGVNDLLAASGKILTVKNWDTSKYINHAQYQILQIKLKTKQQSASNGFDYALTTRIPIPIRSTRDIIGIEGPDRIYYDNAGYNPKWNDQAYKLIWKAGANVIENTAWGIKDTGVNNVPTQKPQIEIVDGKSYLRAPDTYLPPASGIYDGVATFTKNVKDDTKILWVQPIYVTMDAYGSQFFNKWDGKMKIDEESGTIMGSVIGAGKKNPDNTYSGVILGEIGKVENNEYIKDKEGILGYHEGDLSFTLLNDGTATLGKSGQGQIKFNGNSGTIQSGNYEENQSGMQIDLDDGMINANNFQLNSSKVWIDSTAENGFYFKVADTKNAENAYFQVNNQNPIVKMGKWELDNTGQFKGLNDNKYTLMAPPGTNTGNYVFASGSTSKTDWSKAPFWVKGDGTIYSESGTIGGWNITKTALHKENLDAVSAGAIALSTQDFSRVISGHNKGNAITNLRFAIGNKFGVATDGTLYAQGVNLSGVITATSGKIGGWSFDSDSIDGGSTHLYSSGAVILQSGSRVFSVGATVNGVTYTHPYASGLNIGSKGAHSTGGYSTTEGLTADGIVHAGTALSTAGYIKGNEYHVCNSSGTITATGDSVSTMRVICQIDTNNFSIIYKYRTLTFTKGLITSISSESDWLTLEGDWLG